MQRTRNSTSRPSIIMSFHAFESSVLTALSWTTSHKQIKDLLDKKDFQHWETFRDSLVSRWSNGSVVVGGLHLILLENFMVDQFIISVVWSWGILIGLFFGWHRSSGPRITSAMSTILFSSFTISNAAFALGVISLLSSLIAIGFGVGLTYVLGDVPGKRLHVRWLQVDWLTEIYDEQIIGSLHTRLYIFALSVPQARHFFIVFPSELHILVDLGKR